MKQGAVSGHEVFGNAFTLPVDTPENEIKERYQQAHYSSDDVELKELDLAMKCKTDELQNRIVQ